MDQNLRSPGGFILTHTHISSFGQMMFQEALARTQLFSDPATIKGTLWRLSILSRQAINQKGNKSATDNSKDVLGCGSK